MSKNLKLTTVIYYQFNLYRIKKGKIVNIIIKFILHFLNKKGKYMLGYIRRIPKRKTNNKYFFQNKFNICKTNKTFSVTFGGSGISTLHFFIYRFNV